MKADPDELSVKDVLELKSQQMLVVNPEYQRGAVWTATQKGRSSSIRCFGAIRYPSSTSITSFKQPEMYSVRCRRHLAGSRGSPR
jgi:hypothetical protein